MSTRRTNTDNRFENWKRFQKIPVRNESIPMSDGNICMCILVYYYYQVIQQESLTFRLRATSSLEI